MAKVKTGKVEIPAEAFEDKNVTAHISIRLPLNLLKNLRRAALTEEYAGKYQVLIRDILNDWIALQKPKRKHG
jgi:hypothetical protein